ncbi:MAG: hypothetical protein FGM41_09980 [Bacteroidetes bacterium]|jgi:hypothetical protein|nr:hypothetical protein [Bacteroidota bacterium]
MKKRLQLIGVTILLLASCGSITSDNLIGTWEIEKENCQLTLKGDSTFIVYNLPLDVENDNYVKTSNKQGYSSNGHWKIQGDAVKLSFNDSGWYFLAIKNSNSLTVKLLEESGGEILFFNRR